MTNHNTITLPHFTNEQGALLWRHYQSGLINLFEFNEAMNTITEIERLRSSARQQASKARDLESHLPRYIREPNYTCEQRSTNA